MSQPADLDVISTISSGFWEIGKYKANVNRVNQGSEQLEDIGRFIKERIAIENTYSKHLERWNEEWAHYSEKYLKEGTLKSSFDMLLEESRETSKVHSAIKERFNDEVLKTIELFKRDNYHKSTFRGFKEAKEIEDEFEQAQKPWKKLFERVETAKRSYHSLARAEKSAYIQFMNSKADQSIADNANEKCKERFEKCQEDLRKAKANYEHMVEEINKFNSIYIQSMAIVFEKCQRMEMKRLRFVIEMFSGMQKILVDLMSPPKLVQLHTRLRQHFTDANDAAIGEDLKKWSQRHGIDSNTKWPEFEEYIGEFRHIHSGSNKSKQRHNQQPDTNAVVLTKKVTRGEDEPPQPTASGMNGNGRKGRGMMEDSRNSSLKSAGRAGGGSDWMTAGSTGTGTNSMGSLDTEEAMATATMTASLGTENTGIGDEAEHYAKQNSIDSQQSRATSTSKSSRSQSEKPPHSRQMANLNQAAVVNQLNRIHQNERHQQNRQMFRPPPQQQQSNGNGNNLGGRRPFSTMLPSAAVPNDPLLDTFPMITPQKRGAGREEGNGPKNGGGIGHEVPLKFGINDGGIKENAESGQQRRKASADLQKQKAIDEPVGIGQIELDEIPPPLPVGPAKALYDYQPFEDDEIQLIKGETIELLSGPDHLGWCFGVKKNKERGYFPASYVSPLIQK